MVADRPTAEPMLEHLDAPVDRSMQRLQYGVAIVAALAAALLAVLR